MTDNLHGGGDVTRHIQTQLSGPGDIKAAHQFFQPTGGEAHLPAISGFTGGSETTALHAAMKVGESTAMAAAQQAGGQVMSPLIQMIMRMPGHLGLVTSFFEALSHFFAPAQDLLSNVFDQSILAANAEGALNSASSMGDHMSVDMSLLPDDAPFLDLDGGGGDASSMSESFTTDMHGLAMNNEYNVFNSPESSQVTGHSDLNVGGYLDMGNPQFEQSASSMTGGTDLASDQRFLAWENTTPSFRPQMGGPMTVPTTPAPQMQMPAVNQQPIMQDPSLVQGGDAAAQAPDSGAGVERGQLLNEGQPHAEAQAGGDGAQVAQGAEGGSEASTTPYTVKTGDNLWDIAREHFGDGSRWTEIYHVNTDVIGADPRLIHPGATLQLPGQDSIASADYVVKPGDNLWDISKDHLGGGHKWPDLYHGNEAVVGSNPNLIHPGQHLDLHGHGGSEQIASADGAHHAAPSHSAHHAHTAHSGHQTHHVAQAHGAGHGAHSTPSHNTHAAADKVAHGAAHTDKIAQAAQPTSQVEGSQQVPQALAHSPGGEVALKAQQMTLGQQQVTFEGSEH